MTSDLKQLICPRSPTLALGFAKTHRAASFDARALARGPQRLAPRAVTVSAAARCSLGRHHLGRAADAAALALALALLALGAPASALPLPFAVALVVRVVATGTGAAEAVSLGGGSG